MRKILIVDDEADSRRVLKAALEGRDFQVVVASRAEEALEAAARERPDVVLSDVAMPYMSGLALCRRLKADKRTASTPVVLMSGMHRGDAEQADGFDHGADDYIVKPFSSRLLLARLLALLRRNAAAGAAAPETLRAPGLSVDLAARTVRAGERPVALTRKEFDLLAALLERRGRVVAGRFLLESVWGYDSAVYRDTHTVEVHMSCLRRKLGLKLSRKIVTVPGVGYRFDAAKT